MRKRITQFIKIPKITDDCFLYFAEHPTHIPFPIKRVYFIVDPDTTLFRGFHAHKKTKQIMFCIRGSVRLLLDSNSRKKEVILDKPETGLFIDRMVWHEMHGFEKDTILLVLASHPYDQKDYIRDYQTFLSLAKRLAKSRK